MVCWSYDVCCLGMLLVCGKVAAGALFCFWSVYHRHLFSLRICHGSRAIRFSWFVSCMHWEHSSVWSWLLMAAFLQGNKACGNGSKKQNTKTNKQWPTSPKTKRKSTTICRPAMRQIVQADLRIVDGLANFLQRTIKLSDNIDRSWAWNNVWMRGDQQVMWHGLVH